MEGEASVRVDLSVVLPVHNEKAKMIVSLDSVIRYLRKRSRKMNLSYEVIVVDDGSTDITKELAKEYEQKYSCVQVIRIPKLSGKAAIVGMGRSRGELVLIANVDAAVNIKYITHMEKEIRKAERTVVYASDNNQQNLKLNNKFHLLTRGLADVFLPEMKAQTKFQWSFDGLFKLCKRHGISLVDVPIKWKDIPKEFKV